MRFMEFDRIVYQQLKMGSSRRVYLLFQNANDIFSQEAITSSEFQYF